MPLGMAMHNDSIYGKMVCHCPKSCVIWQLKVSFFNTAEEYNSHYFKKVKLWNGKKDLKKGYNAFFHYFQYRDRYSFKAFIETISTEEKISVRPFRQRSEETGGRQISLTIWIYASKQLLQRSQHERVKQLWLSTSHSLKSLQIPLYRVIYLFRLFFFFSPQECTSW